MTTTEYFTGAPAPFLEVDGEPSPAVREAKAAMPVAGADHLRRAIRTLQAAETAERLARRQTDTGAWTQAQAAIREGDQLAWQAATKGLALLGADTTELPPQPSWWPHAGEQAVLVMQMEAEVQQLKAELAGERARQAKAAAKARPPIKVSGYASTSRMDLNGLPESVALVPQAWVKAWGRYAANKCPLLWDHDRGEPLGHITAAVARPEGLFIEGTIETPRTKTAIALYDGLVAGKSAGFSVALDRVVTDGQTVTGGELVEISIVPRPANRDCLLAVDPR